MVLNDTTSEPIARTAAQFATTHWSVVLAAGDSASPGSREALEKLCQTYWYPLYAFIRRTGYPPEDAKDCTQAFFERFIEKHYLKDVVQEKGRFRSFLLTPSGGSSAMSSITRPPRNAGVASLSSRLTPRKPRPGLARRPLCSRLRNRSSREPGPKPWSEPA